MEIDCTSHEARLALERLLLGDGNALERILSPYLVCPSRVDARLESLRVAAKLNLSRRFYRHYRGFFTAMVKRYLGDERGKLKTLLYVYRVALTGINLLEHGELCGDIVPLLDRYALPDVRALLERKAEAELSRIDAAADAPHVARFSELEAWLERAYERSTLPDEPAAPGALDAWLRAARRAQVADR